MVNSNREHVNNVLANKKCYPALSQLPKAENTKTGKPMKYEVPIVLQSFSE